MLGNMIIPFVFKTIWKKVKKRKEQNNKKKKKRKKEKKFMLWRRALSLFKKRVIRELKPREVW